MLSHWFYKYFFSLDVFLNNINPGTTTVKFSFVSDVAEEKFL